MKRLARLLPRRPFSQFARLRAARRAEPCASLSLAALPAVDRVSLRAMGGRAPARASDATVRVYRGPSRVIMVGNIDAVCQALDRAIANEHAGDADPFGRV
jgi:hypothetical protein